MVFIEPWIGDPISPWRTHAQALACEGMKQRESSGVQPQLGHAVQAVDRITEDWVSQFRQVNAKLVGSSGDRTHPQLRGRLKNRSGSPEGEGRTTVRMGAVARGIALQSSEAVLDPPASLKATLHLRFVQLAHTTLCKQLAEAPQTVLTTRQKNQAGRITIKSMHQMQGWFKAAHPTDERVLQIGTSPWLTQQPRWFERHHHPFVLIQNR